MGDLQDLKVECTRDESKLDSAHEKIDKLSSDDGKAETTSGGLDRGLPMATKSRVNIPLLAFGIAIVAAVILAVLLLSGVFQQEMSPEDRYREYVDASNDRDVRRMFDQTVTRFNNDYDLRLENLSNLVFFLNPKITILNLSVVDQEDFTLLQDIQAQVIISDVEDKLSITVDDSCYVQYTVNVEYQDIDQNAVFDGEVLCVSVNGHWYLAVPGYY